MKRLGMFTGKIYDADYFKDRDPLECCLCISDERAVDEEYLNQQRMKNKIECCGCHGCPASQKHQK